jgi:hypothetical protein
MRLRLALASAALGIAAIPFAAHAGCVQDLAGTRPPDPHSITYTYIHATEVFVGCAV